MYSSKEQVNILTALLVKHGVRHAVVCPGSRNAPIVHNLNECPDIVCHAVTDERSAGFYALGIAQIADEPVVVCVTSGSALLNVAPAVAEAHYQHQSLIVVSADRPAAWIGQLDGQTLPQPGVFGSLVALSVTLPEPSPSSATEARWHCNRLVNEALLAAFQDHHPCVHINVPISEPLFDFDTPCLPDERLIKRYAPPADYSCLCQEFVDDFMQACRPMIVVGQIPPQHMSGYTGDFLFSHVIVLHEQLAPFPSISHFDEVLAAAPTDDLLPDFVLYIGDTLVSKRLKHFLRRASDARVWRVSQTGEVEDTFQNLRGLIVGDAEFVLEALSDKLARAAKTHEPHAAYLAQRAYRRQWLHLLKQASSHAANHEPPYSQMTAVRLFEQQLTADRSKGLPAPVVHYANSMAVRLANIYASHHVWCNRGVNGIEGSLSTAAGCSLATTDMVYCVIGDLSFFYDQNALWNEDLNGNLRILLLNNGQGAIFRQLPGLEKSAASDRLVVGRHDTSAQGICQQNGIDYRQATDMESLTEGLYWLTTNAPNLRPALLEVMTDAQTDAQALLDYYCK